MTKILFGPYGTRLAELGHDAAPLSVLETGAARRAVAHVATEYVNAGSDVATVNGFGVRGLLHQTGGERTYFEALQGQNDALMEALNGFASRLRKILSVGPAHDCYDPSQAPSIVESQDFHSPQLHAGKILQADAVWFETLNTINEGIGVARAAQKHNVSTVLSFVLNGDGRLLSGESALEAIQAIDRETRNTPLGYSFNCCPLEVLDTALTQCAPVIDRVLAVYPNAAHDAPDQLDGLAEQGKIVKVDQQEQTARHLAYLAKKHGLQILGGCCGYDYRDIARIHAAVEQGLYTVQLAA